MSIHQEVIINAAPQAVYDILLSSEKFTKMTGGREAKIATEVGGAVSLFGGEIQARHVDLLPGKRVVQAWRAGNWPEGHYSIIKFELVADGNNTKVIFDQSGHPDDAAEMLEGGWKQMYWDPISALVAA